MGGIHKLLTKIENRSRDLNKMTRRGSENSHEDEEGGGRAFGLAARGGLLALAGAVAGPKPTTITTAQKLNQEHRPAITRKRGTIVPPQDQLKAQRSVLPTLILLGGVGLALHGGWS
jgi:hypothetical protein